MMFVVSLEHVLTTKTYKITQNVTESSLVENNGHTKAGLHKTTSLVYVIKIAGRNRIFSSLGIEAKLIENLFPPGARIINN